LSDDYAAKLCRGNGIKLVRANIKKLVDDNAK